MIFLLRLKEYNINLGGLLCNKYSTAYLVCKIQIV